MTGSVVARGLLLALLFSGCRQVLGVDDFGTKGVTYIGATDGYTYRSGACRDCVDEHCEDEAAKCDADPRCAAQAQCLALCRVTDHDCRGRCKVSTPSTASMAKLVACQAEHCGTSLPNADRCAGSLALHGNAECDECLAQSPRCRSALETVSKNESALEFERRDDACTCHGECPEGAPECERDVDEESKRQLSELSACCIECDQKTTPDWSCIGSVSSPITNSQSLELWLQVTTPFVPPTPIPNLRVRPCSAFEAAALVQNPEGDCGSSSPHATTSVDGWAKLTISRPPERDRYFDLLRLTSDEETYSAPALFYFFPPIRETPTWISRRMVARNIADGVLGMTAVIADWDKNGGIVFSARSCDGALGEGLRIVSRSGLTVHYLSEDSTVAPNATKTSRSGQGFIANVPPGPQDLEARAPSGELVGKYSVIVVPGSLTHIVLGPTPSESAE